MRKTKEALVPIYQKIVTLAGMGMKTVEIAKTLKIGEDLAAIVPKVTSMVLHEDWKALIVAIGKDRDRCEVSDTLLEWAQETTGKKLPEEVYAAKREAKERVRQKKLQARQEKQEQKEERNADEVKQEKRSSCTLFEQKVLMNQAEQAELLKQMMDTVLVKYLQDFLAAQKIVIENNSIPIFKAVAELTEAVNKINDTLVNIEKNNNANADLSMDVLRGIRENTNKRNKGY